MFLFDLETPKIGDRQDSDGAQPTTKDNSNRVLELDSKTENPISTKEINKSESQDIASWRTESVLLNQGQEDRVCAFKRCCLPLAEDRDFAVCKNKVSIRLLNNT